MPILLRSSLILILLFVDLGLAQHKVERRFAGRVSENQLTQHVRRLVGLGNRYGGTASGDLAAQYIQRRFEGYGLSSKIIVDPERITFTHEGWNLQVEKPRSYRRVIKHAWLSGYSPAVPVIRAKVSFLDHNQKIDISTIESTLVLTPRTIDPKLYSDLVKAGAQGILSYTRTLENVYSRSALITDLPATLSNPIPMFNISTSNADTIKNILARGVDIQMKYSARTSVHRGNPKTVVAEISGKQDSYFIVCAHGDADSGGPGADDNASGVAGVLELARVLNGLVKSKIIPQPEYTIRFIIWGSEYYSSDAYVRNHAKELTKIKGVLNFDQIGSGATRNCVYFESNDVPHNQELLETLKKVGEDYVGKEGFWEEATTNPSQGGTDSYVFLPKYLEHIKMPNVKIPSVTIFTAAWNELRSYAQTPGWSSIAWKGHPDSVTIDYSAYYHSSLDLPQYTTELEPFNMAWVVKATGIALLRMAWIDNKKTHEATKTPTE